MTDPITNIFALWIYNNIVEEELKAQSMTTEEKFINLELVLKEFASRVKHMRDVQSDFFATRSKESLQLSKRLERQVDISVKNILKTDDPYAQQELFKE